LKSFLLPWAKKGTSGKPGRRAAATRPYYFAEYRYESCKKIKKFIIIKGMGANYLEILSFHSIAKSFDGQTQNAVPFTGFPKKHPGGKGKFILVSDPLGDEPVVLEFNTGDLLFAEELPAAVTREGEGVPLVKIWVRKGAVGVILEPFEVREPLQFKEKTESARRRFLRAAGQEGGPGGPGG
jgi:hypothetical protein